MRKSPQLFDDVNLRSAFMAKIMRNMKLLDRVEGYLIWAGLLASLSGCHEVSRVNQFADGAEFPIIRQVNGIHSHETRPMQLVIRDTAALAKVPIADVEVDFSNQMLLIVTLGRMTSDQYTIKIDRVWRDGHELRVATTVTSPPPEAPIAMSSPYCIAVVPSCDLNVSGFSAEPPTRERSWSQSAPPARWDK
jgi:hypothetical protein